MFTADLKSSVFHVVLANEPWHDKTNKLSVCPAKTQISLGIRPVWSESSLSAWRKLGPLATHWAHSEDSDQTGRMPRLIWVFAGRTPILLVLSRRGSNDYPMKMTQMYGCQTVKLPSLRTTTGSRKFAKPCKNVACDMVHWFTRGHTTNTYFRVRYIVLALKIIWAATWQNQQSECAPSEDSDQPGHPPSLIRVFAVRMKKALVLRYPLSAQRRLIRLRMPRLIWVFAGRTLTLLVLSCRGSFEPCQEKTCLLRDRIRLKPVRSATGAG